MPGSPEVKYFVWLFICSFLSSEQRYIAMFSSSFFFYSDLIVTLGITNFYSGLIPIQWKTFKESASLTFPLR